MPLSFPHSFPAQFGSLYSPSEATAGGVLELEREHIEQALERLLEQYKGKPRIETLLGIYVDQLQEVEEAFWQLLVERWVDNALGAQLDILGAIVGQKRDGRAEEPFRAMVRARILANRSRGTAEDLIAIVVALLDATASGAVKFEEHSGAQARVLMQTTFPDVALADVNALLQYAKAGGVRLFFEAPIEEAADTFTYGNVPLTTDNLRGYSDTDANPRGGAYATAFASTV